MYSKRTKIIASMLIFMLTITHFNILGQVLATSLENQNIQTNNSNVEFDMYFAENNEKVHSSTKEIEGENYIYALLNVKNAGYLKNANITLEDGNFEFVQSEIEQIQKIENGKIYLNKVKNGNSLEIAIPIQILQAETINIENFNKENKIKFSAIYVDGNGKEKKIEKEINIELAWTNEKEAELSMQVSKFIPFTLNENKGVLLQTVVTSNLKNNILPTKETSIEIDAPIINNEKPQEVKVFAKSTKATNGNENAISFTTDNYTYNEETNKLVLNIKNEENNGNISWKKDVQDEFIVNYIYSEEVLNSLQEETKLKLKANSELIIYEKTETKVGKAYEEEISLKGQIGNFVDIETSTNVKEISKGQIYANYQATNKQETEYKQNIEVKIAQANLTNKIVLEQQIDNFITEENAKLKATDVYFKTIALNKNEANNVLKENGKIEFYVGTTKVAEINKETEGEYKVDLSEFNINEIRIEIVNPQEDGNLNFEITKAIKGTISYTKEEMQSIKSLELNVATKVLNEELEIETKNVTNEITFTEPTSQAELKIDKTNLSTVVTNENVKVTAILKTDTLDCNLYKNPTLRINFPSYIENITIKNIEVLFDTDNSKLMLKAYEIITNADGSKTILVTLDGTQEEYTIGAISKGVNIVITTDITVNKLTPNKQEQITMLYTNEEELTKLRSTATNQVSVPVTFVAPTGVVTTTAISNYKEGAETLTSISGEEKTATIETMAKAIDAKFEMNVINNYKNTIDTVSILGRIPFEGNKNIDTLENLSSTMTMHLTSNITVTNIDASKVKIYYSENGEATNNLNTASNGWTLTPENLANVKSYLIVTQDYTINTADKINFTYTAQIPENLQHNQSAYENYVVYFNNNLESGTIQDKQVSTKTGVTTGKGPVVEATLESDVEEQDAINTGKFIKYTLTVKNVGEEIAENVVVKVDIPNCTHYIKFFEGESGLYNLDMTKENVEYQIGNMNPNEKITKSFWVVVDNIKVTDICTDDTHYTEYDGNKYHSSTIKHTNDEYKTTILTIATISATNLGKEIKSNEVKNTIKKAYFSISTSTTTNGMENLRYGDTLEYTISVEKYNVSDEIKNAILTIEIPQGLKYKETQIKKFDTKTQEYENTSDIINYDEKTRILSISIEEIEDVNARTIKIISEVEQLPEGEYERKIISKVDAIADGIDKETSNVIVDVIVKSGIIVSQQSTVPENGSISAGESFSYKIIIENIGKEDIGDMTIEDKLPNEVQYVNTEYTYEGEVKTISNIDADNVTRTIINISQGEKVEIIINVVAKEIEKNTQISNVAIISSELTGESKTNIIKHTVEAFNYEDFESTDKVTRKIMGQIWKDTNLNGIKDEDEEKVSNVELMLFNNETGKLVTDADGNVLRVQTDENGEYTFSEVYKGRYTVIFLYDTANYSATTYRKENVDETKNSDGIDTQITLDGITRMAAITEEIEISTTNIYNIDLGLVINPKFDLKIDKTISKITVQNSTETKVYEFKNAKLAKKDIPGKVLNDTTIVVEYKISVTNEGAISGYVKKIADYMPSEMKFSSELNKDWYMSGNDTLYNASLSNTLINPGETKEVTLTLTKKMTENNIGLYHNEAEIFEAYNDLGIEDIDSIEGNKMPEEDDISSADVLITVKTGEYILFIGLTLTIIVSIGTGAYFIKKKILR